GNGANAGALSPFAPTGIIVNGIMAKNQMPGLETSAYLYNLGAHALVAFAGYALFGGLRLFAAERTAEVVDPGGSRAFDRRQWITLGVIAALLVSVIVFKAHVGLAAFVAAVLLVAARAADDGEAIKLMPWRVIIMVSGVTVLIALVERFQGIDLDRRGGAPRRRARGGRRRGDQADAVAGDHHGLRRDRADRAGRAVSGHRP